MPWSLDAAGAANPRARPRTVPLPIQSREGLQRVRFRPFTSSRCRSRKLMRIPLTFGTWPMARPVPRTVRSRPQPGSPALDSWGRQGPPGAPARAGEIHLAASEASGMGCWASAGERGRRGSTVSRTKGRGDMSSPGAALWPSTKRGDWCRTGRRGRAAVPDPSSSCSTTMGRPGVFPAPGSGPRSARHEGGSKAFPARRGGCGGTGMRCPPFRTSLCWCGGVQVAGLGRRANETP
jgi:hypothetical protein